MACSGYESITDFANQMDNCSLLSLRADIARLMFEICDNIPTSASFSQTGRAGGDMNITVANTPTQFPISENVFINNPSGTVVGDTIVIQADGLFLIEFGVNFPTSAVNQEREVWFEKNGVNDGQAFQIDNGVNDNNFYDNFYRRFEAGDIITFWARANGTFNDASGVFRVTYLDD